MDNEPREIGVEDPRLARGSESQNIGRYKLWKGLSGTIWKGTGGSAGLGQVPAYLSPTRMPRRRISSCTLPDQLSNLLRSRRWDSMVINFTNRDCVIMRVRDPAVVRTVCLSLAFLLPFFRCRPSELSLREAVFYRCLTYFLWASTRCVCRS